MKKPKILICGGAGYIGGYVTDLLTSKGYKVAVYDNLLYEHRYLKNVPFIFGDIRDGQMIKRILPKFDIVIWLAALVGDPACALQPSLSTEINYKSTKWFVENYKGKIIFASTCSVYGINHNLLDEDAPTHPLSVYAKTKLEAERFIIRNSKNHLIFRLGTLFGLGDAHSRIRFDLVVNALTKKAVLHEPMVISGKEQWRPLLHVKDVAEAIVFGIEHNIRGIYNLSYKNFRINDIGKEISRLIPSPRIKHVNIPEEDMRNYRVTAAKFKNMGWKPKYNIKDGIIEIAKTLTDRRLKEPNDTIYSNASALLTTINELK